jgi:isoleucyl-tRNA synthetase
LTVTDDLAREGVARDVIRLVQQARREAGLHVSDRIRLTLGLPDELAVAVREHAEMVRNETLARELVVEGVSGETNATLDDVAVRVAVERLP